MILGMTTSTFTLVHVVISLAGLGSGFIVAYGLLTARRLEAWTALFLATTILTCLTGFLFPVEHILPSHRVGIISVVVLAIALVARYAGHMEGSWRPTYIVTALIALYLNTFVAVVQSFLKIPALHALAPQGKEPPFVVAQLVVMAIFGVIGIFAVKRFRLNPVVAVPEAWKSTKAS